MDGFWGFSFWLLYVMQLWIWVYKYLFEFLLSLLGIYLERKLLDHSVIPCLIFLRNYYTISHCVILSSITMADFGHGYSYLGKSYTHIAQGLASTACIMKAQTSAEPGPRVKAWARPSGPACHLLKAHSIQLYKNSCLPLDQVTICHMTYQGENPTELSWNCQPSL